MNWKNYNYKIEDGAAILLEYLGEETCVVLPQEIDGYPVTVLEGDAFFMTVVETVVIPASIRTILHPFELGAYHLEIHPDNPVYQSDGYALYEQQDKGKVLLAACRREEREVYHVQEGTIEIADHAMEGQEALRQVILPDGVLRIGEEAFGECLKLEHIRIPEGLTEIGEDAFHRCVSLEEVDLPASLRCLGVRALTDTFGWSEQLNGIQKIRVADGNPKFFADENAFYEGTMLIKYFGCGEQFQIPSGTEVIGYAAFRRSRLKTIRIPASVREVQRDAFRECSNIQQIELQGEDTILYIPQIPVYRKDEVLSCFHRADQPVKKISWKAEPFYSNRFAEQYLSEYAKEGNLAVCEKTVGEEGAGNRLFDYIAYDALIDTYARLDERCHMAVFRLRCPVDLSEERKAKYQNMLSEHFAELLKEIAKQENIEFLSELAQVGYFTEANIDAACEILNQAQCTKLMSYLMEYKQEHFGMTAFDFSL